MDKADLKSKVLSGHAWKNIYPALCACRYPLLEIVLEISPIIISSFSYEIVLLKDSGGNLFFCPDTSKLKVLLDI